VDPTPSCLVEAGVADAARRAYFPGERAGEPPRPPPSSPPRGASRPLCLEGERRPTHTRDGAPDGSSAAYPTTNTPYAGQPNRQRRREERGAYRELLVPPSPEHGHGSLGAEGVEDARHRDRAPPGVGARLGPERHGVVAHREHVRVPPQRVRRLLQDAADDGAADDETTRGIGGDRGIVVGADHVEKCSCRRWGRGGRWGQCMHGPADEEHAEADGLLPT
jgi:hypothetical protein